MKYVKGSQKHGKGYVIDDNGNKATITELAERMGISEHYMLDRLNCMYVTDALNPEKKLKRSMQDKYRVRRKPVSMEPRYFIPPAVSLYDDQGWDRYPMDRMT